MLNCAQDWYVCIVDSSFPAAMFSQLPTTSYIFTLHAYSYAYFSYIFCYITDIIFYSTPNLLKEETRYDNGIIYSL